MCTRTYIFFIFFVQYEKNKTYIFDNFGKGGKDKVISKGSQKKKVKGVEVNAKIKQGNFYKRHEIEVSVRKWKE